jgi:hypothetical protein
MINHIKNCPGCLRIYKDVRANCIDINAATGSTYINFPKEIEKII